MTSPEPIPESEAAQFLLRHMDAKSREQISRVLQAVDVMDGFALYLLTTRANRRLVSLQYADRIEMRSGRTLTVVLPDSVQRVELPETQSQFARRLTDLIGRSTQGA